MGIDDAGLLQLMTWLSPAFPTGAFSYSGGLEAAVADGLARDPEQLADLLAIELRHGMVALDAAYVAAAWGAAGDEVHLQEILALSWAQRTTPGQALESGRQGQAFLATVQAAWPHPQLARLPALAARVDAEVTLPVATGAAAAAHGIPVLAAVTASLHAAIAALIAAGQRLLALGQTRAQQLHAALAPAVLVTARASLTRPLPVALATPGAEFASLRHETLYSRIFRT